MTLLRGAPRLLRASLALCKQPALRYQPLPLARQCPSIRQSLYSTATSSSASEALPRSNGKATREDAQSVPSGKTASKDGAAGSAKGSLHKVYVGNLPASMDVPHLKSEFEQYGEVVRAKIVERGSPSRRFGFVKFATAEAAQQAIVRGNGQNWQGRLLQVQAVDPSRSSSAKRAAPAAPSSAVLPSRNLFVGGLPQKISQDMLYELFSKHGEIESVNLPTRKKRTLANGFTFAFVSFREQGDADKAIKALNNTKVEDGVIKVSHVKTPWRWPAPADGAEQKS